jgi:cyclophilin family peptidyl-prolyl cis-trans isomerase
MVARTSAVAIRRLVPAMLIACGSPASPSRDAAPDSVTTVAPVSGESPPSWSGVAWPPADARRALIASELARDTTGLDPARDDDWRSYARIGPVDAPATFLQRAAGADPSSAALAAVGLLEPLPGAPGEAVQPSGPWATLERDLWTRLAVVDDPSQYAAIAFAIGRIGGRESQRLWAVELAGTTRGEAVAAFDAIDLVAAFDATNIACARRHPLHVDALPSFAAAIDGAMPSVRRAALGALARCAAPSAESFTERERWVSRLSTVIDGDDPESARLAWKALAALGERVEPIPAPILGEVAPPWLVEVEAVRALGAHASTRRLLVDRLVAMSADAITGTRATVVWTALQSLRRGVDAEPESFAPLASWRDRLRAATPAGDRHRVELTVVLCELEALAAIGGASLEPVERCAAGVDALPEHYGEALAIEALVAMAREGQAATRAAALLDRAKDHRPQIAAAALAALADVEDGQVNAVLRDALVRADAGVLAAAAGAIAARAADRDRRDPTVVGALEALLRTADAATAMEARLAAIEALGGLARSAGEDVAVPAGASEGLGTAAGPVMNGADAARQWLARAVVPLAADRSDAVRRAAWGALEGDADLQAQFLAQLPARVEQPFAPEVGAALDVGLAHPVRGLRVHTDLGSFVIEFEGAPSPVAAANLVALAKAGTFDGLRFHRVVPGFVAQGGDPHGDGYGGPGWVLPCEWSDLRYERGTVGMALAGKDTGGSQFFIAQTRQPHLDGRFTVVGRVREGLDLVDRLLPHDRILRVEVVERDGATP